MHSPHRATTRISRRKRGSSDPWPTAIEGTNDPELFRNGIHGKEIIINVTVAPGTYHVDLKFADNLVDGPGKRTMTVEVNGEIVAKEFDVWAKAGARAKVTDLVLNGVHPKNGIIAIRLTGDMAGEGDRAKQFDAFVNALEVGPGDVPTTKRTSSLLRPQLKDGAGGQP